MLGGVCLSACWDTPPLGCGLGDPPGVGLETPWVWPWRPPWVWAWRTPGHGPADPPARPLNFPLGCGPGDPPGQTPQLPPGCGPGDLQGMLGYHPPRQLQPWMWAWKPARHAGIPPHQRPAARHAGIPPAMHSGIPPMNRITGTCKNITLPQLLCWR